jgi:DNA modification methylase
MNTEHKIFYSTASNMSDILDKTIGLIITSPPYPMIEMWDELFASQSSDIKYDLINADGYKAFNKMHDILSNIWRESLRVLKDGCYLCINIGDATRKIGDKFRLYTNHSKITQICEEIGIESLPAIIWRKQTNAPNKFMGSGMLPSGAYVTLEHEYILIFRKGSKRVFDDAEKLQRRESAFFWEERNAWFSDLWEFKGTKQTIIRNAGRERSAAFPFELAYRLINMYSLAGEIVLDPFLGTGTTTLAAICSARSSTGYEIDEKLVHINDFQTNNLKHDLNNINFDRLRKHIEFINNYNENKGPAKHINENYNINVITAQETNLKLWKIENLNIKENTLHAKHSMIEMDELKSGELF